MAKKKRKFPQKIVILAKDLKQHGRTLIQQKERIENPRGKKVYRRHEKHPGRDTHD